MLDVRVVIAAVECCGEVPGKSCGEIHCNVCPLREIDCGNKGLTELMEAVSGIIRKKSKRIGALENEVAALHAEISNLKAARD